jgi:alkanesulfonate monooxygenase SsuD/methylene tetrahydromethanopterin reductase-like flavin-dependent oxidoreductase (luciferase family)
MATLGLVFPADERPEDLLQVARAAERAGIQQLWLWEDCFAEGGIATAAAALAATRRLTVCLGLLPAPLRNVALTAMELATLARMFPGRLVAGVGHGVAEWMAQVGALPESPMTLLREYAVALDALLAGRTVTSTGRYVRLADVTLQWPPSVRPQLLIGAVGPRTTRLAGEVSDGVILTGGTTPPQVALSVANVAAGRAIGGRDGTGHVTVFVPVLDSPDAPRIVRQVADYEAAGATQVALLSVGPKRPALSEFAEFVGREIGPRVAAPR